MVGYLLEDEVGQTLARARFHVGNCETKMSVSEPSWNMRSAKGARDSSESSVLQKISKKSEHFWNMRSAKGARDCSESSISQKMSNTQSGSTFGR